LSAILDSVSVIVVTYNSAHCIKALSGLLANCPNVIFSDNSSRDGTVALIEFLLPHAKILKNSKNIGFGSANNLALAIVDTKYAFLLNPDCEITIKNLANLINQADQYPDAAIYSPVQLTKSGKLTVNYRFPRTHWKPGKHAASGPCCVGFTSAAAMLLRMSNFSNRNFFDEDYFLYYEDDDLCLRMMKNQIIVFPNLFVIHRNRSSVSGINLLNIEFHRGFHHIQSKLRFYCKYQTRKIALQNKKKFLFQTILILPLRFLIFSPRLISRMIGRFFGLIQWKP
jgi:N-acetylglucosaminyl-diphospho-decaprenol L-rhamnosyltransferase